METQRPRVLIVDDDPAFSRVLSDMLTEAGFDPVVPSTPQQALACVAGGTIDAAIVDLVMPEISGTDLAAKIRVASPDTSILILTGHADLDSAIESIHQGVFDYLRKEALDVGRLKRAVRRAVDRAWLARENRRLMLRLQESKELLEALDEMSAALAADSDVNRLLARLCESAKQLCQAERARVALLQALPEGDWLITATFGDEHEPLRGTRLKPGEGILSYVVGKPDFLVLDDPSQHPSYSPRCDQLGATMRGYAGAPLCRGLVKGALIIAGSRAGSFLGEQLTLLQRLSSHAAIAVDNALRQSQSVNYFTHTCDILVNLLDTLDVTFTGHSRRVAALSDMTSRRLGLGDAERRNIHFGALLHDIGKMRLGPGLLGYASIYGEEERRLVRQHPALGVEILSEVMLWAEILPVVLHHHERWDGKGYPHGLAGEEIPLGARIVSVAEVFDMVTRALPYQRVLSAEEALAELNEQAGRQFDPRIVRLFCASYREHRDQLGL